MTTSKKEDAVKTVSEKQRMVAEFIPSFLNFTTLKLTHALARTNTDDLRFEITVYMENGVDAPVKMTFDRTTNSWRV
jgi:hypothetical protein